MPNAILSRPVHPSTPEIPFEIPYILNLVRDVWKPFYPEFEEVMHVRTKETRATLLYWWLSCGLKQYPFPESFISLGTLRALYEPFGISIGPLKWSWMVEGAFCFETYPQNGSRIDRQKIRQSTDVLKWFHVFPVAQRQLTHLLSREVRDFLRAPHEDYSGGPAPLSRLQVYYHELTEEMRKCFDLTTPAGRESYLAWFNGEGKRVHLLSVYDREPESRKPPVLPAAPTSGVNLIGHTNSVSGVGEDIRMAGMAFSAAGVLSQPIGYMENLDPATRQLYPVSLHCVTGFQILLSLGVLGEPFFKGRYNIGYFPWELEEWPDALVPALELCDELWTSSQFIYDAIQAKSPRPVRLMPMGVEVPESIWKYLDSKPAASGSEVKFLFMFDFVSGMQRKNATACLETFEQAFAGNPDARLTIKVINPQGDEKNFNLLKERVAADPRMTLVSETLDRESVLKLVADHDVFISLHRAEGFGRGIAEALLLGKHVVTTNYSGNVDFCRPEFTFLVDYDLVPVKAQEYVFSSDQKWADVRIPHAVEQIRKCYEKVRSGARFNAEGQAYIRKVYSKEAVGARYRERLEELKLL